MKLVRFALLFVLSLTALVVGTLRSEAQATSTASKSAEISAFGGLMPTHMDYGPHTLKGFAGGADFTVFPHLPVAPSLEVVRPSRQAWTRRRRRSRSVVRVQRDVRGRLHPYVIALIGIGDITYHPAPAPDYKADSSKVLSYGGGINIDVSHHFGAKLDVQRQSWNFGHLDPGVPTSADRTIHPYMGIVGVTYTVPFRILNRQSDFHSK